MNNSKPVIDYKQVVSDAGIPTTAAEMQTKWNQINTDQGSLISNDSKWSAFWQLITAIVTVPAQWVVNFLITTLLPNSFIASATKTFLDILAWGVYLERKEAFTMSGNITFTRVNVDSAQLVESGTIIQTPPINGTVYQVAVVSDTVIEPSISELDILCNATGAGAAWNLAPGYYSILPEPVDGVASVRNNEGYIVTTGTDEEDDESLQLRCRNQFSAVGEFHNDAVYIQIISSFSGISPAYIYLEHGAPRGPGSANSYIMIDSGVPDQSFIDPINSHIRDSGYHGLGDDMMCYPVPSQAFTIAPTAWLDGTLSDADQILLLANITDMIQCAFRNNTDYDEQVSKTFPNSRFSFSVLGEELHQAFIGLNSIEFNQDDIDLTGAITLPVIDTLTVTQGTEVVS